MNYVGLIGRITKDPELKVTESGRKYVRFTLAVNKNVKNAEADFLNCVAWEQRADLMANYVRKGNRIGIQGSLTHRNYKVGEETRSITEVLVNNIEFLESKNASSQSTSSSEPVFLDDPMDDDSSDSDFPF